MTGVPPVLTQAAPPAAPVPPPAPPAAPEIDLSQFMGGAPPAAPVMAAPQMQAAPAVQTTAEPPKRTRGSKSTPPGALPQRLFEILKDNTGLKSEELGAAIGVSRQTFDNYAKGKAHCQPTAEGLNYLRNMLAQKIALLQEAQSALPQ
jgi:DNA-binding XRE family transcriptional regulator